MLLTKTKLLNSRNLSSISHSISSRYLKVLLRIILNVTTRIHDLLPANPYVFEVILINEGMCLEYYVNLLHFFIFYFIWMMTNLPFMMTDVFCMVSHSIKHVLHDFWNVIGNIILALFNIISTQSNFRIFAECFTLDHSHCCICSIIGNQKLTKYFQISPTGLTTVFMARFKTLPISVSLPMKRSFILYSLYTIENRCECT